MRKMSDERKARIARATRELEALSRVWHFEGEDTEYIDTVSITLGTERMSRSTGVKTILELWGENGSVMGNEAVYESGPWGGPLVYEWGEGRPIPEERISSLLEKLEKALQEVKAIGWHSDHWGQRKKDA